MITAITNYFEKRRYRNVLKKFVTKEVVGGKTLPDVGIRAGKIEIILVFVRGNSVEQNSKRMALVSDLAMKNGWVVEHFVSSLVIIVSGMFPNRQHPASSRRDLTKELHQQLDDDIKIVHGATDGHFGGFGSSTRFAYTFLIPKFDSVLARLGQIEFGNIEEIVF